MNIFKFLIKKTGENLVSNFVLLSSVIFSFDGCVQSSGDWKGSKQFFSVIVIVFKIFFLKYIKIIFFIFKKIIFDMNKKLLFLWVIFLIFKKYFSKIKSNKI
jgi:hypothetical protein